MYLSDLPPGEPLASPVRPLLRPVSKKLQGAGLPTAEAAAALNIPRRVFMALCEGHGILELRYFEGQQRRRFLSDAAVLGGVGWNANLHAFRRRQADYRSAWPFPVFARSRLDDLAECLDWPGIKAATADLVTRRERRDYLLACHPYLLDDDIAELSCYSRKAIHKARAGQLLNSPCMVCQGDSQG